MGYDWFFEILFLIFKLKKKSMKTNPMFLYEV